MLIKQIKINRQIYRLEIGSHQSQRCFRCQFIKEITLISYREKEVRQFCYPCSLVNISELGKGDYEVENKTEVIRELWESLNR